MRLFYALTLTDSTKQALIPYRDLIANTSIKGRFTAQDNLHLTLEFIGEVPAAELTKYEQILNNLTVPDIVLNATFIGSFKKRNREIVWMGFEKNQPLMALQRQLIAQLIDNDLISESRKYRPHITLGRQVLLNSSLENLVITPLEIHPYSVALMESKRAGDRLVYEPLAEVLLHL